MSDLREAIGANIRALRLAKGDGVLEFAQEFGMTHPALSNIERGFSFPSIEKMVRMADYLGCTVDTLVYPEKTREFISKEE